MRTNEFLYGKDVEVPEIDRMIIIRRIELLKDNLAELLEVSYSKRDTERVAAVLKAVSFWENME